MSRDGFTLMELLVVLAILAIAYAIASPRLSSLMPKARLEGAARTLATEIQRARFRSIAEGYRYRVTFNTGAKTYQVCSEPVSGSGNFTACDAAKAVDDGNTITIATSPSATTQFNSRGICETVTAVTLTASGGEIRRVGTRTSGNVYVQ